MWNLFLTLIFISGIGAIVYFVLNAPNPAHFFKTLVVDAYDNTYGAESRKKLWQDWNWLYQKKRIPAEEDYHSHRTRE